MNETKPKKRYSIRYSTLSEKEALEREQMRARVAMVLEWVTFPDRPILDPGLDSADDWVRWIDQLPICEAARYVVASRLYWHTRLPKVRDAAPAVPAFAKYMHATIPTTRLIPTSMDNHGRVIGMPISITPLDWIAADAALVSAFGYDSKYVTTSTPNGNREYHPRKKRT